MTGMASQISDIMAETFGVTVEETDMDRDFDELAVDSLMLVELALLIRKRYGVTVTEEDLGDTHSITDLANLVEKKRTAA